MWRKATTPDEAPGLSGVNKEKTDVAIKVAKGKRKIAKGDPGSRTGTGDMKELPPATEPGGVCRSPTLLKQESPAPGISSAWPGLSIQCRLFYAAFSSCLRSGRSSSISFGSTPRCVNSRSSSSIRWYSFTKVLWLRFSAWCKACTS